MNSEPVSPWEGRVIALSRCIRATDGRVLDVGAGNQALRKWLPHGCHYLPLDKVPGPGVLVCDLETATEIPGDYGHAIISGVLEHLADPRRCLALTLRAAERVSFSYVTTDLCPVGKRSPEWKSALSDAQLVKGLKVRRLGIWGETHALYHAVRKGDGGRDA